MSTSTTTDQQLETYFEPYREETIGRNQAFESPYGLKHILYADWTASGRLYRPIEHHLLENFGPFVGNTHTETNITGTSMTLAYHKARQIIKKHVNAGPGDCIISYGSGMTGVMPERWRYKVPIEAAERPVIFVTHMEHHSNQTSWIETICEVVVIAPTSDGLVDLDDFARLLEKYQERPNKIAAVTACSNVTGIRTPYHQIAAMVHKAGGLCFVDFACSAPYVPIDMSPAKPEEKLDAIYFSPHKFLGGPGSCGVLVFDTALYHNRVPDNPGGGTVKWTNPWNEHDYIDDIEAREDGGTPPFLQTIRTALCVRLKEQMGVENMLSREEELVELVFEELEKYPQVELLAGHQRDRLGVFSFIVRGMHYNLGVRLLNDRFGIQVRGGCSCAGTYGHYLLDVDRHLSGVLTTQISHGDLSHKPGWIRMSIHPSMTNDEVRAICNAIGELANHYEEWASDYRYDPETNEFIHLNETPAKQLLQRIDSWFDL